MFLPLGTNHGAHQHAGRNRSPRPGATGAGHAGGAKAFRPAYMRLMAWSVDARIPLSVLGDAAALAAALAGGGAAALLVEAPPGPMLAGAIAQASFAPGLSHGAGCACCGGRSAAAEALDRLFQARVRGQCGWFTRVLALAETPEAAAELATALREDALTAARFRLDG